MNEITKINTANVHEFILKFVPDISVEHLKPVPDHLRGGDNFTFYYRDNSILKIPENECRDGLLKEAKLTEYLNTQQLPVAIPKLLQSHDQGFYALFSRIGRPSLAVEALEGFTHASLEALAQSLGTFLSFLHNHTFPEEVLGYIPRAEDTFEWTLSESRQQIACIEERAKEVDTARWKERLERLQESLVQKWAVLHCDLQ